MKIIFETHGHDATLVFPEKRSRKNEKCVFHVTLNRPIFVRVKLVLVTRATLKLTNRMRPPTLQEKTHKKRVSIQNINSLHRNMKKFDFHL